MYGEDLNTDDELEVFCGSDSEEFKEISQFNI